MQDDPIQAGAGGQAASRQRIILRGHPNFNLIYDLNTRGLNGRQNPAHSKEISMTKLNNLVNLPFKERTQTMVGRELPSTLYDFYDFAVDMIQDIYKRQNDAQVKNNAATKSLTELAASGGCPQKCKVKLKVSLGDGKEEHVTKAQTALDQELAEIAKKASDEAANIVLKIRRAMKSELDQLDPVAEAKRLASEAFKKLSGDNDRDTLDEKFHVMPDDESRLIAMSSALFSLALYYGKIMAENKIAEANATRTAEAQAKAEKAAKKSAADAVMANADANMDKKTLDEMIAKALKKQAEKLTAEFDKKLQLMQKNVGGDQSARTGRRGRPAQSPHWRDGAGRGRRGRSQTPRGSRDTPRQSRASSRESSQERGRQQSPSRSTRDRSQSTSSRQRQRFWFDPRPDRGSSSQRDHGAGASSEQASHSRSRSPGRGRGRGRGRGHRGRGGRDQSQGRDRSQSRDRGRGRGRGAPRRSSRSGSRSPRSSSEEYRQEREFNGRRHDRGGGQQHRGRGGGRGARGRPWTRRGHHQ